jgi:hypothetical protein
MRNGPRLRHSAFLTPVSVEIPPGIHKLPDIIVIAYLLLSLSTMKMPGTHASDVRSFSRLENFASEMFPRRRR